MESEIPFEEAIARVVSHCRGLASERVSASDASGRTLARDLVAPWPWPPHDHAALDGFAVHANSTVTASPTHPSIMPIVGQLWAGDPIPTQLPTDSAMEVATGALIPPGADTVIPYESTDHRGQSIVLTRPATPGANIRRLGEDVRPGERFARAGDRVDPALLGLMAAFGMSNVAVSRRARVSIIATGNELYPPSQAQSHQVMDTNSPVIAALALRAGAEVRTHGIARDELESLREHIRGALTDADLVVTIGGASVGPRDLVASALSDLSAEVVFRRVALKPGKPCGLYRVDGCLVLSLPGNPAAASLTFETLGILALDLMQGALVEPRSPLRVTTDEALRPSARATTLIRGVVSCRGASLVFRPTPYRSSASLRAAVGTNAIAIVEPQTQPLLVGTEISCLLASPPLVELDPA